ncbi:hypothetical protein MMC13_001820 [Lambiella insularis]|nr:hypothetical protein [Lambiella insularis]
MSGLKRNVTQLHNSGKISEIPAETTSREKSPVKTQRSRFPVKPSTKLAKSLPSIEEDETEVHSTPKRHRGSGDPWKTYHKFMRLDQAGPAIIAYYDAGLNNRCLPVAIKEKRSNKKLPEDLLQTTSTYIVQLMNYHMHEGIAYMVYEYMDVSLRHIQSIPKNGFTSYEIGAVCRELLSGVDFIHKTLKMTHGDIHCGNILVDRDGNVKIANIGTAYLEENVENKCTDIRGIGKVMIELMEPDSFVQDPTSLDLRRPEVWSENQGIVSFLGKLENSSLAKLQDDPFLPPRPTSFCLIPYVYIAMFSARREWGIVG